ncbi:hypothetical protein C7S18_12010 [Ahniella affigens]|uniref:Lipoprotein n=1 Tax=Ahniella affigens TaxID=2021234 RepID=A0A2P1PSQ6_9GAMM|nr:hypothetical protein [Ahniella affigens]AVP97876.1 hypothetical protein C7S18_12010 [Ahniella affigens]
MQHDKAKPFQTPAIARRCACTLVFAFAVVTGCAAKEPDMLTVGGESKHAAGTLLEAQAGDIACYLSLKADDGTEFQESAAFEICEDASLVGKRLKLSYSVENVLAAECEGDVDCGKSDQIVLVSAVRVIE